MTKRIDLDEAAGAIERRRGSWRDAGIEVGQVTWRDHADGWPAELRTERGDVTEPYSIGVQLRRGAQEGSIVLFDGGWADFVYWDGTGDGGLIDEAPGYDDWLDLARFDALLDRLAGLFQ